MKLLSHNGVDGDVQLSGLQCWECSKGGNTCHNSSDTGQLVTCNNQVTSCFKSETRNTFSIINELEATIDERKTKSIENSYVASLLNKGVKEIAKKVTEEAGETSIAAVTNDGRLIDESADLLFHLLVLLKNQDYSFKDVLKELNKRSSSQ